MGKGTLWLKTNTAILEPKIGKVLNEVWIYNPSTVDPSFNMKRKGKKEVYICIYVDDIFITKILTLS